MEWLHFLFSPSCTGEGNGNPLQCSCLENPRDREAWWAALCGVAQSRIWLKRLSSSSSSKLYLRQWHPTPVLLPGKSHGQRSLIGCSPWYREESYTTERLLFHFSLSCIGEGNGNPLQCSCLENPRDRGAWWAAVSGVTESQTWLKRLSSSSDSRLYLTVIGWFKPILCPDWLTPSPYFPLIGWLLDCSPLSLLIPSISFAVIGCFLVCTLLWLADS